MDRLQDDLEEAPSERTVRRHLAELASAGFLERADGGSGVAHEYDHVKSPGSGEVEVDGVGWRPPGQTVYGPHYTVLVRVASLDGLLETVKPDTARELPPPTAVEPVAAADPPD